MGRPKLNPDFVEKTCLTCQKTFSVSFYKRNVQRFCSKACAQKHPDTLAKMAASQKEIHDLRYGGHHPMQTTQTQERFKQSMLNKHGVDHPGKMSDHKDKTKKTLSARYGDENYNNKEQTKETCLEKYGVSSFLNTEAYRLKSQNTCIRKYGVDHPSKTRQFKLVHNKNMFSKFMDHERFVNFEPLFGLDEYSGVTKAFNKKYPFKCKRCNYKSEYFISNGKGPICPTCDKNGMSFFQKEIVDYVTELLGPEIDIAIDDRTILSPKELDIYIPKLKLAIECNGLYWHSECIGGKNKVYHLNKMKRCLLNGIRLLQIWEDEWKFKQSIIKSILKNLFSRHQNQKVFGRKCVIRPVPKNESDLFLVNNHLQGKDISSLRFGLYSKNELVSLMTFCKSRFDKKVEWEMSRFCNKLDTSVIGSAGKLFNHFINNFKPKSIVSYSDRRFFTGNLYVQLGFLFSHNTSPNYFYIMGNYATSKNRMSFQKHKLKKVLSNFNPALTEWGNMQAAGFDRIWDCGNTKWVWHSTKPQAPQAAHLSAA